MLVHIYGFVILSFQSESEGEAEVVEEEHVELFTTPVTKMGAATSDFGYNLFRALSSRDTSANIFLSPISVSAVLTQLSMGECVPFLTRWKPVLLFPLLLKNDQQAVSEMSVLVGWSS